jgi:hypothetical protein
MVRLSRLMKPNKRGLIKGSVKRMGKEKNLKFHTIHHREKWSEDTSLMHLVF